MLLFILSFSSRLLFSDLSALLTLAQTHVVQHDLTRNPGSRRPFITTTRSMEYTFNSLPPPSTNLARDRSETIEFFVSVYTTVDKDCVLLPHPQSYGVSLSK